MFRPGTRERKSLLATIVLSTYNQPEWLKLSLLGYGAQDLLDFEVVLADDGSGEATRRVVEELRPRLPFPVEHLWQPDEGFRKTVMLNRAIMAAAAPYLIVSDGDCIPRRDFVRQHLERRRRGRYLSGGYVRLNEAASRAITSGAIERGEFANAHWLRSHGMPRDPGLRKLARGPVGAWISNLVASAPARWNGLNASCWRDDAIAVNGFDERMRYGGEDLAFGERLARAGIRARMARYDAIVVHLEHPRGYRTEEDLKRNRVIRDAGIASGSTWTDFGIRSGSSRSLDSRP